VSALERIKGLPDWPGRMTAPVAAAYMGISAASFLSRYRDRGFREGANVLWARAQLDRIIATQFDLPPPAGQAAARDTTWDDFEGVNPWDVDLK